MGWGAESYSQVHYTKLMLLPLARIYSLSTCNPQWLPAVPKR